MYQENIKCTDQKISFGSDPRVVCGYQWHTKLLKHFATLLRVTHCVWWVLKISFVHGDIPARHPQHDIQANILLDPR